MCVCVCVCAFARAMFCVAAKESRGNFLEEGSMGAVSSSGACFGQSRVMPARVLTSQIRIKTGDCSRLEGHLDPLHSTRLRVVRLAFFGPRQGRSSSSRETGAAPRIWRLEVEAMEVFRLWARLCGKYVLKRELKEWKVLRDTDLGYFRD